MSLRTRFLAMLLVGVGATVLVTACSEIPSTSAPSARVGSPTGPSLGYLPPFGCASVDVTTCGKPGTGVVHTEQLQVCKQYPAGTVNPPAVQIRLDVTSDNVPRGPQTGLFFTIQPNSCLIIWQNGEEFGPLVDTVEVTEMVPAGYAASSQLTEIIRDGARGPSETFTTTVNPSSSATTVKSHVGGDRIPGALIVFTNTLIPPPPPVPVCALTQGYWKNHEDKWPAPYSPTAPWLNAGHQVTGVTWDALMSLPPKGGNSYLQLAHQWIAATLNGAVGSTNPAVTSALSSGGAWLLANTPVNGPLPSIKDAQATAWATTLDNFNNGFLGTPHCD